MDPGPGTPCFDESGAFGINFPVHHEAPAWSSKGLIAYRDNGIVCVSPGGGYVRDSSLAGLWILDPAAGTKIRIRSTGWDPAWSPDGNSLTFSDQGQIFVMNADGSSPRQLTTQGFNIYPGWHPDGERITFNTLNLATPSFYSTWIVGLDGSGPRELCPQQTIPNQPASWHPSGARYAHVRYDDSTESEEIFEADTTSCTEHQLTGNSYRSQHPVYSPSGNRIAFTRWLDSYPPQVWVMNADGTEQRQVTRNGAKWPTWSPDGTQIAFVRYDGRQSCQEQGVIWVVHAQSLSGAERQLTYWWPSQCESLANVSMEDRGLH